jgi:hypothetical protein
MDASEEPGDENEKCFLISEERGERTLTHWNLFHVVRRSEKYHARYIEIFQGESTLEKKSLSLPS